MLTHKNHCRLMGTTIHSIRMEKLSSFSRLQTNVPLNYIADCCRFWMLEPFQIRLSSFITETPKDGKMRRVFKKYQNYHFNGFMEKNKKDIIMKKNMPDGKKKHVQGCYFIDKPCIFLCWDHSFTQLVLFLFKGESCQHESAQLPWQPQ